MRFEDKKLNAQRRKGRWITGLVTGPAFALTFCIIYFTPKLILPELRYSVWIFLGIVVAATAVAAPLADRVGKKYNTMADQFAGPVALCSILFGTLFFALISMLMATN